MSTNPSAVFQDLEAIKSLYRNGDLSEEQRVFPYYATKADEKVNKVTWLHRDTLKNLMILDAVYPAANGQRGK